MFPHPANQSQPLSQISSIQCIGIASYIDINIGKHFISVKLQSDILDARNINIAAINL
jgi:hypothetical protein